ncbi:MAG: hypothetical protein JWP44_4103, partial [Mucilaginibacter sp.]|nr:hypothetical protein [Mucilaginibacter sp.]
MLAAMPMIKGSFIFLMYSKANTAAIAINAVGTSTIERIPIIITEPTKAPITDAVIPS